MGQCIADFFNGDPEAGAKMMTAQCRREAAQKKWLAFCVKKYSGAAAVDRQSDAAGQRNKALGSVW
jgi:hypothetical protein